MEKITHDIIATHHAIWDALIQLDFDRLAQLYPEDHLIRHSGGYYQTREEYFNTMKDGTFRYYTYEPVSETVRQVSERRAILHAKAKTDARIYGVRKVWRMDFELPYELVNGQWLPANDA